MPNSATNRSAKTCHLAAWQELKVVMNSLQPDETNSDMNVGKISFQKGNNEKGFEQK